MSTENGGNRAGNFQLNANTGVSMLLVAAILGVTITAVYKATEVITDMGYIKRDLGTLMLSNAAQAADVAEMKRIIQRLDRQQSSAGSK